MGLLCNKSIPNCTHRHCALPPDLTLPPRLFSDSLVLGCLSFPLPMCSFAGKLGVRLVVFNGLVGFPPPVADAAPTGLREASSEKRFDYPLFSGSERICPSHCILPRSVVLHRVFLLRLQLGNPCMLS
ncbi:hypothetical protein TIFTF001_031798 [Ficus carica]|uniref:Uncharacterized protein n=1 Tax=Ficus carica TaxID=3494 RepID=A0AA88DVP9_FICCA|nr:hypothetical protein TIFTF001_031798 [Ficus carica]